MNFNGGGQREEKEKECDVLHVSGEKGFAENQIPSYWGLSILKKKYYSIGSKKKSNLPLDNITVFTSIVLAQAYIYACLEQPSIVFLYRDTGRPTLTSLFKAKNKYKYTLATNNDMSHKCAYLFASHKHNTT